MTQAHTADRDFAQLNLQSSLLENLSSLNYQHMTEIQAKSLPVILQGKDIIAKGKTGSGKTAAFGLGLLEKLNVKRFRVQSLVLCPTRELADQVAKDIRKLGRGIHNIKVLTLCGGMPIGPQIGSLEHGAHIIVGTPGRIEEHLRKETLSLGDVKQFVLDEADRMLEMGFQESIDNIVAEIPSQRQTLLFSATYPKEIASIAENYMHQPVSIEVQSKHDEQSINQSFYRVPESVSRTKALCSLLMFHRPKSTVVFCNTKRETKDVAEALRQSSISAMAIHGDLDQKERDQALVQFSNHSVSVLVATDVAARGLDIEELDAVMNYQLARELDVHTHRIGRTGRAGAKGIACTLFTEDESYKIEKLQHFSGEKITPIALPARSELSKEPLISTMQTLQIDGGKKQKLRAGDILGALTAKNGITGQQVGKISLFDFKAYVAVEKDVANTALKAITQGKLKGKQFKARLLNGTQSNGASASKKHYRSQGNQENRESQDKPEHKTSNRNKRAPRIDRP